LSAVRILSLSFLVLACGAAAAADNGFEEFVIDTGFRVEQPILVADLPMNNTWRSTRWIRYANRALSH
jgi:hypothetical protein